MGEYHRRLGRIESVSLRLDRGCLLCLWLHFDFGGSAQGFGDTVLHNSASAEAETSPAAADYIASVMKVFGVESLQDIVGEHAYALYASDRWGESVIGVQATEPCGGEAFVVADWRKRWFGKEVARG